MHMMDERSVDIASDGTVEVTGLKTLKVDAIWIVDIAGKDPQDWKVIHKEKLGKKDGDAETKKEEEKEAKEEKVPDLTATAPAQEEKKEQVPPPPTPAETTAQNEVINDESKTHEKSLPTTDSSKSEKSNGKG